jgi:hypothetical protein
MKVLIVIMLALVMGCAGCATADKSLGHTLATVTFPDGTKWTWDNSKNIDLEYEVDPATKKYKFSVKSITPEGAMANVAASNAATAASNAKIIDAVAPFVATAIKAGALVK